MHVSFNYSLKHNQREEHKGCETVTVFTMKIDFT